MTGSTRTLRPGEAVPLHTLGAVPIRELLIGLAADAGPTPDMVALLVDERGRVRGDDDLVFYNNSVSPDGAVRYQGEQSGAEWVRICPSALDADVTKVVLGCAGGLLDEPGTASLTLSVLDGSGAPLGFAQFPADGTYRAMILFEVLPTAGSVALPPARPGLRGRPGCTGHGVRCQRRRTARAHTASCASHPFTFHTAIPAASHGPDAVPGFPGAPPGTRSRFGTVELPAAASSRLATTTSPATSWLAATTEAARSATV